MIFAACRKRRSTQRRRRWSNLKWIVLAIFALILTPYVHSRWQSDGAKVQVFSADSSPPQETRTSLTILAYNIAHGRGPTGGNWDGPVADDRKRIGEIAELIRQHNPDVVVLNEVDFNATWSGHQNQAAAIAEQAGFPYRVEQRNLDCRFLYGSWRFGNALLSWFPIVEAEPIDYPVLNRWEHLLAGSKQGCVCTLQVSPTQQMCIFPIHLEVRSEEIRVASVEEIIRVADRSNLPTVFAGDFNSSPSGFPLARRTVTNENAMDVLVSSRVVRIPQKPVADALPTEQEMTFAANQPDRVIDWILPTSHFACEKYRVLNAELSDHRAVLAELRIRSSED